MPKRHTMVVEPWANGQRPESSKSRQMTLGETMRRYREHRGTNKSKKDDGEPPVDVVTPATKENVKETAKETRWSWLVHRRDIHGNRPEDDGFDPRTLYIPQEALKSMTAFQRQYWSMKMYAMDLVLFVRVGSFYELYDVDADVGLKIGLKLVGGQHHANFWKCGCRASSFNWWAKKCISLGYRVGRVEEVQRGSCSSRGNVVERRLVQTYGPGTCHMSCGNELQGEEEEEDNNLIFCLYEDDCSGFLGGCLVNTLSARLEVAEWMEVDSVRSSLVESILEEYNPMEIVISSQKNLSMDTRRALSTFRPMVSRGIDSECCISYLRPDCDVDGTPMSGWQDARDKVVALVQDLGGCPAYFSKTMDTLFQGKSVAIRALLVCLNHFKSTGCAHGIIKRATIENMVPFSGMRDTGCMILNATSLKNLEIHQGSLGTKQGSLYAFLSSKTCTGMGRRCVRTWLSHPLANVDDIEARLDAVEALNDCNISDLLQSLESLPDVEKMMPTVAHQLSLLNLEDEHESLMSLSTGIQRHSEKERVIYWGQIQTFCVVVHNLLFFIESLTKFMDAVGGDTLESLLVFEKLLSNAMEVKSILLPISGSLPLLSTDLGKDDPVTLPEGIWQAIDEHMISHQQAQYALDQRASFLISMVAQNWNGPTRVIKSIRLTGVGEGIGLACPKSLEGHILQHLGWQPHERTRSGFLYKDEDLVQLAISVQETKRTYNLGVNQAISVLGGLFLNDYGTILAFCQVIGELDALQSFSRVTLGYGDQLQFTRPQFISKGSNTSCLNFKDVWNPQILSSTNCIPEEGGIPPIVSNSICLGGPCPSTILISGANSGGKTTLLKTIAIATIMSQVGCYVPCSGSMIATVTRIMTRLGARDRIQAGESTFAIEMKETSAILQQVDRESLAIIDELGRGTAPREGEAIAWAVLKALAGKRCRTLFATHFHDLNKDFEPFPDLISRYHMKVPRQHGSEFHVDRFMLFSGPAPDDSTGGMVCALNACIPEDVVHRASHISKYLRDTYGRYQSVETTLIEETTKLLRSVVRGELPPGSTKPIQMQILDSLASTSRDFA